MSNKQTRIEMTNLHPPRENEASRLAHVWARLLNIGFRLLYNELAWTYDLVAWLVSFGQWKEWGQAALPYLVGQHILELGHGPGHLLVALAERGFRPTGLDLSPQMARLAHRRLRGSGTPLTLVRGRAQELPFPAHTFDSIVSTFPTAYIFDPETLVEVARVVRPGGRLVSVMGARLTGRDPFSRFIEWLYSVTGQRRTLSTESGETLFAAAGLAMRHVQVELGRSQVQLLVADRITLDE